MVSIPWILVPRKEAPVRQDTAAPRSGPPNKKDTRSVGPTAQLNDVFYGRKFY